MTAFETSASGANPAETGGVRFLRIPSEALWDLALGFGYQHPRLADPFAAIDSPRHEGLTRFATRALADGSIPSKNHFFFTFGVSLQLG